MKRNVLFVVGILVILVLAYSSLQRIMTFRGTSSLVEKEEKKLDTLKAENENLKNELNYTKSERFVEGEIRDKLGLAKDGEEVFVVPEDEKTIGLEAVKKKELPNWKKWRKLLLGKS